MAELFIPGKLQDIVRFEPITDDTGKKIARGRFSPESGIITIDPEYANIKTLCEELFHRKQNQFLESHGLFDSFTPEQDYFYNSASEIGIIPTVRDIAIRNDCVELNDDVTVDFIRYFREASNFAQLYNTIDSSVRDRFLNTVRGNRLFGGIQAVLDYLDEGYNSWTLNFLAEYSDEKGETQAWDKINEARKRW